MSTAERPGGYGILFVLSGPSGVGKDALLDRLLHGEPHAPWSAGLRKCVTATTRAPRPGEVNGVDYHFWDEVTFQQRVGEPLNCNGRSQTACRTARPRGLCKTARTNIQAASFHA